VRARVLVPLWQWLDDRFPASHLAQRLGANLTKPVPAHVNWTFTLGSALTALLSVQLLTGALLMIYYKPSAREAYASVERIITDIPVGWLMRSMHSWGSHLIIIVALLHMARVFAYGGYKRPREVTWIIGVALFAIILIFGFTGYLLPWDQVASWGTVVATEAPASIPVLGPAIQQFMIGGTEVADPTLGRFFVIHVFVLPLALLGMVSLHLVLVRYQGISPLSRTDEAEPAAHEISLAGGEPFYPNHTLKDLTTVYLVMGVLLTLALLLPPHLGDRADPLLTPLGIKPEWYFLPAYQLLKYVPEAVGVHAPPLLLLLLVALPLIIDISPERHPRRRPRVIVGMVAVAAVVTVLGVLGHLSETTRTVMGKPYHFDMRGIPHLVEESALERPGP
jgi:ubiquinol-cytochrome c reductase cytochrome b subunit